MFRRPISVPLPRPQSERGFVFYDIETSGLKRGFDQILQFAAIRTDAQLLEMDRFEISCRLMPHIVPSPEALAVTQKSLRELTDPARPSHYEMMCEVRRRLIQWGRNVFLGYNSVRFDEEFLRQAFYQTLHPPFFTNTSGNVRTDILPIVRAVDTARPGCIFVPTDGEGRKTFRLEAIAKANSIGHENAHDAMSDVSATVELARLVRNRTPDLWTHFVGLAGTAAVSAFIDAYDVFVYAGMAGGARIVSPLGRHPTMRNIVYCFDLLGEAAHRDGIAPLVRIKTNSAPPLMQLEDASDDMLGVWTADDLRGAVIRIRGDRDLARRLVDAAIGRERTYPAAVHVEEQLYGGFWSRRDSNLAREFHQREWPDRQALIERIEDQRLRVLARRLIYFERPDLLRASTLRAVDRAVAKRLLGSHSPLGPWLTISRAIDAARDPAMHSQLAQLEDWGKRIAALLDDRHG